MPEKQDYQTRSRSVILDFLQAKRDVTVSASDITEHLKQADIPVDPATVYRYLNKLTAENQVLKFSKNGARKSVYQYIGKAHECDDHLHIKCVRCGRLIHLDCDFMREIRSHLKDEHGFTLQCDGSILYGICDACHTEQAPVL